MPDAPTARTDHRGLGCTSGKSFRVSAGPDQCQISGPASRVAKAGGLAHWASAALLAISIASGAGVGFRMTKFFVLMIFIAAEGKRARAALGGPAAPA